MKYYRTGAFTHAEGKLHLTDDQADARKANLKPLGGNFYQTKAPVGFKAGEEFGCDRAVAGAVESSIGARDFSKRVDNERRDRASQKKATLEARTKRAELEKQRLAGRATVQMPPVESAE